MVNFQFASTEIAHAFNINNLVSLNLRACPCAGSLLKAFVESGESINIRSLELVVNHSDHQGTSKDITNQEWIAIFLTSFEGLRSLRLLASNDPSVTVHQRYLTSIFHHRRTLKELVYHERTYNYEWLDCNRKIMSEEDDLMLDLFRQMSLNSLGLCLNPEMPPVNLRLSVLNRIYKLTIDMQAEELFSLTPEQASNLKILCMRSSGIDRNLDLTGLTLYESEGWASTQTQFLAWAFGYFPELLFIAFGDYSYGRRFEGKQQIFFRHPFPEIDAQPTSAVSGTSLNNDDNRSYNYLRLQPDNSKIIDHLDRFKTILEACPVEPLYVKDF